MLQPNPPESENPKIVASRRLPLIGGLVAVLAIGIFLAVVVFGGDDGDRDSVATDNSLAPAESGGLAADAPPVVEGSVDLTARPTAAAAQNLADIGADDRFVVTKFGIDAPLTYRSVGPDGQMPNPEGPDDVAYYDFSSWPGMGGAPGRGGNGVFAGHVDSGTKACKNGTVMPPCQAVFWEVSSLKLGDQIELRIAGQNYKYRVTSNQPVPAATAPWDKIVASTAEESITLITCAGNFNRVTREYSDRQVVTAVRM